MALVVDLLYSSMCVSVQVEALSNSADAGSLVHREFRVTSANRLFQSGMDEQLIVSRTGHRSVQGVRTYKKISDDQRQTISSVLNATTNGCNIKQATTQS